MTDDSIDLQRSTTMPHTIFPRILWMFAVAAIFNTLYAVDGVTLIEPSRVGRGNITPNDAPGFPITISQPGSYRLTGNLTIPDTLTTGIEITADNVTLDLNGFSIIGPTVCTANPTVCNHSGGGGAGIHAGSFSPGILAPSNVRVMNGMVRGMGFHGVRLMGDGTIVERVHAYSNGGPGIVVGDGSVIDSFAVLNGGAGIIGTIVRGNISTGNLSSGIFVRGPGGVATGNSVKSNGNYGIDAYCAGSIVGNTATGNQPGNFRMQGTGTCTLTDNAQ
jgi:hypothetical protein